MAKDDLMEHAASTVDFYELLGVTFETSESDIRRAYRKTALKYHPDKLGKDFDPEQFHLLQIAHDVLSDPAAKTAYDNARSARLQRQRQNDIFKGKRRKMKEDLEARERGGSSPIPGGEKRPRQEDEMEKEIRRLAEEGKRRRREMEKKIGAYGGVSSPAAESATGKPEPAKPAPESQTVTEEVEKEDEITRLERRIREAEETKARRKAEKKARKSGIFVPADSPSIGSRGAKSPAKGAEQDITTPTKRPDTLKDLKVDKVSATPKFSFTPTKMSPIRNEFSATMERLKAAERRRLEEEIKRQEAEATQ